MPFQLISSEQRDTLQDLVARIPDLEIAEITANLASLIHRVHQDIPEKRRTSTGRYSIVKALGREFYLLLQDQGLSSLDIGTQIFNCPGGNTFVRALGLKLLVESALESGNIAEIQPNFETAAGAEDWILRECASGLVRPLIKTFPDQARVWYLELVRSPDPNLRRFVSESLRPVVENRWFHKTPDYALGIITNLFQESDPYPRTSVGNSLSDWMRVDQNTAWPIVEQLINSGDSNSYWIAYRACRNLVKKQPLKVLDLLGVDEFKYKKQVYRRTDLPD